jgi:hypothetical protein
MTSWVDESLIHAPAACECPEDVEGLVRLLFANDCHLVVEDPGDRARAAWRPVIWQALNLPDGVLVGDA